MTGPFISCLLLLTLLCCAIHALPTHRRPIFDYDPEDLLSESRLLALFDRWNHKHGKHYPLSALKEKQKRFEIFKQNLHHIHKHNQGAGSPYSLGLTRFADLTNDEFRASKLFGLRPNASTARRTSEWRRHAREADSCRSGELQSSLDWREMGVVMPMKDQGSCGSCWAFATISAVESVNAIATGDLVSLSEQELVSCDSSNYGCDGGYMDLAMEWIIENGGVDLESAYPYTSSDGVTGFCNYRLINEKAVSIDGYVDVSSYDEDALLCAASQAPVIVAINGGAYDFQLYAGGVFDGTCSGEIDDLDHAVVVEGWGTLDGLNYWIVRNSWGTDWGLEGYIYMIRSTGDERGICGINTYPSYPIKLSETPSPDISPGPTPAPQPGGEPPPVSPPPPSPPPPAPFFPPPPAPEERCDLLFICPAHQTCCCIFDFLDICLIWGCCDYQSAVCCDDNESCCPSDYPICDLEDGYCLQDYGPGVVARGVPLKKRTRANLRNPLGSDNWLLPLAAE